MIKKMLILLSIPIVMSCSRQEPIPENKDPVATFVTPDGKKVWTGLKLPMGYKPDPSKKRDLKILTNLPSSFDWRAQASLHPVRDQGSCGSCWAMASTSVFEDTLKIKAGITRDLAEQFPLSCAKTLLKEDWSCNGGLFAYDIFKSPWGAVNESDFPYSASDEACKSGLSYHEKIIDWASIDPYNSMPSVEQIKSAMYQYGPIGVAVAVDNAFSSYRGGVHKTCNSTSGLNHAVVLVGWNDADGGYWIMRNSWGQSWGEGGYMRIAYGCDQIGSWANYVVVESTPGPNPPPPDPPSPTPDPNPTPTPTPQPPCTPKAIADTGKPDVITVKRGSIVNLGTPAREGHSYVWTANPPFDNGARPLNPQIRYQPRIVKKLTLTATTKCGSATDSVLVDLSGIVNTKEDKTAVH